MDTQNLNNDLKELLNQIILNVVKCTHSFYFTKEDVFVICEDGQYAVCEPEFGFRIHCTSDAIEEIVDRLATFSKFNYKYSILTAFNDKYDSSILVLIFEKQSDSEEVTE